MHPEAKGKGAEPQKNLAWTWVSAQEVGDASDCLLQRVPLASIRLFQPGGGTALRSECCFRAIHGSSCKYTYAKPTSSVSSSDFHLSCAKAIIQVAKPDLRDPLQIPIDIKKLMCSWEATENMSAVFHRFCREMVPPQALIELRQGFLGSRQCIRSIGVKRCSRPEIDPVALPDLGVDLSPGWAPVSESTEY